MNPCKRMEVHITAYADNGEIIDFAENGNEGECTGEEGNCGCDGVKGVGR
ncbi:hypothetical protein [Salibacterium lacus]|uniref:Uncharacterized protein n=1 Tax=Salibacterium lacus TaxID=1898109 RepID=A0ABW5SX06_9BACI